MEESILHEMNQLHKNVEFKQILQEKNCVNLWDLRTSDIIIKDRDKKRNKF